LTSLSAEHLQKSYGARRAVVDASFSVEAGRLTCLIGRNGAGKTTTMEMLLGLRAPDAGVVRHGGHPLPGIELGHTRASFGYLPEVTTLFEHLTPREQLCYLASLHGEADPAACTEGLLESVGVAEDADRPAHLLSLGVRRRVGLAAALVAQPRVLLLDEPTANLDPFAVATVRTLLRTLRDAGVLLLVSTHDLDFASQVGDHFILMAEGAVRAEGTLESLRREAKMAGASLEELTLGPLLSTRAGGAR
jgi:ABC-2 type transport system ATP-binding protein